MKLLRTMFLGLCLLGRAAWLVAGTSSENNTTVDTTAGSGPITITMHRAKREVLENVDATALVDEPLRVKAVSAAVLSTQPQLPAWYQPLDTGGGLVADGVTPLLFRIATSVTLAANGDKYDVSVRPKWGVALVTNFEGPELSLPGSTLAARVQQITLTSGSPAAFVVLNPIRADQLIGSGFYGPTVAHLEVRDATTGQMKALFEFGVSRPPVALVHGYNVKANEVDWGGSYYDKLEVDRAPGFVIPVGYGLTDEFNTTGYLIELTRALWEKLLVGFETEGRRPAVLNQWAWTRNDAVGHSQGGVLLRLLCSRKEVNQAGGATVSDLGFDAWKNHRNFHRGRFHRVVTIGSPHAGSTAGELGWQLRKERRVPYGIPGATVANYFKDFDRLFQEKFRIGNGSDLAVINSKLVCDSDARLHLVQTTIYDGDPPGSGGALPQSVYPAALYLTGAEPTVQNPTTGVEETPGTIVAPDGYDGVVDARSQTAGRGSNRWSAISGEGANISHAVLGETQTQSLRAAETVSSLLAGNQSLFGSVTIPSDLFSFMEDRRVRIATFAQLIDNAQRRYQGPLILQVFSDAPSASAARGVSQHATPPPPVPDAVLHFTLDLPVGEIPVGTVEWSALVYGPAGVSTSGLTLITSGNFAEQLTATVGGAVQGQVVLSVSFPSVSGKEVSGLPQVVFERLPGAALTGIALEPTTVSGQVGAELPLLVRGIYDGSVSMPIFTSPTNTVFQSSNTAVATVDGEGRVKLMALGTATITATYAGTLIATVPVTVLDVLPIVVNPPMIPATVGQALTFQLSASQVVQTFVINALPAGLALDAQSGLIEGVPTTEGRFPAVVTVQNANGTGSKQMEFVIAGVPGAPTDVGVDAAGVNGGKPVGAVVGRLVTVDPNPLDTFTYALVSGAGGTDNALFTIAGDSLVTAAVLDGATTSTVSIRVRTTDSSGASFEKALVLAVGTPPAIVRQPDGRTVFAGESAIFFVETTGLEPLQYQWKKDGVDVAGATSRIFEVPGAALADGGNYTVAVSNGDGSVTSAAASLVVNPISYGRWASVLPSGMASALFEPGADYDADGIVNFLDFAFGVQPGLESGVSAQPAVSRDALGYVLTYREANGISPLTYRILKSADLGVWVEHVPGVGEVGRTDLGTHTEVWVRLLGLIPGVFLKIEVTSE